MSINSTRIVIFFLVFSFSIQEAKAYADPGTGAMLWQALAGAFIGFMFYFHRFIKWIEKKRGSGN